MWTATLTYKRKEQGNLSINIDYTDGKEIITDIVSTNSSVQLEEIVANRINQLNSLDVFETSLTLGAIVPITKVPTQAELDKIQFFKDYKALQQIQDAIKNGTLIGTEKEVTDLEAKVKAEYKPEYFI